MKYPLVLFLSFTFANVHISLAFGEPDSVPEVTETKNCPSIYARFRARMRSKKPVWATLQQGQKGLEHYEELAWTSIEAYFPRTETIRKQKGAITVAEVTSDGLAQFKRDFDLYFAYKAKFESFPLKKFHEWIQKKHGSLYPSLDPAMIEMQYKTNGYTLKDLSDELIQAFLKETVADPSRVAEKIMKHTHSTFASTSADVLSKVGSRALTFSYGLVSSALLFGPGVAIVNSFLSVPMDPILQYSGVLSNRTMGPLQKQIQAMITELDSLPPEQKEKVKLSAAEARALHRELEKETEAVVASAQGLSPQENAELWKKFQERFYILLQRVSQTLPGNLQSGRGQFREMLIQFPLDFVEKVALHHMIFHFHKRALKDLDEEIKTGGGKPTDEQKQERELHVMGRDMSAKGVGAALAGWAIFRYMIPEVSAKGMGKKPGPETALLDSFGNLTEYVGLPAFADAFREEMKKSLSMIDEALVAVEKTVGKPKDQK